MVHFIGRSSKLRTTLSPGLRERLERGLPVIYAFWHRYQLLMLFEHRNRGVPVLVSQSRDGELIAKTLHRFGFETVRGSSSRGGGSAFLKLVDIVRAGRSVAFTPDGPRGPFRSIQPGVLALAAKTGAPIVPVAWAGSRTKELKSWDRFLVPAPFARYAIVYGDPLFIAESDPTAEDRLRSALNAAETDACRRLEEKPSRC